MTLKSSVKAANVSTIKAGHCKRTASQELSSFFDLARWASALMVVIFHTRQLIFPRFIDLNNYNAVVKFFYFITSFGHESVVIFFVLSGYLVGGNSLRKLSIGKFHAEEYFIHRICRIYTVLLPALILTFALDKAGLMLCLGSPFYNLPETGHGYLPRLNSGDLSAFAFVGNALMLNGILTSKFGTNGPLWSLAAEWWYYMIFGFCTFGYASRSINIKMFSLLVSLSVLLMLPIKILLIGACWLVGIVANRAIASGFGAPRVLISGAILMISLLVSKRYHPPMNFEGISDLMSFVCDLFVALSFALLILSMAVKPIFVPLKRCNRYVADFSYSLYVTHYPVIVFFLATISYNRGIRPLSSNVITLNDLITFVAVVTVAYLVALLSYLVFERHTSSFARLMSQVVSSSGSLMRPAPSN